MFVSASPYKILLDTSIWNATVMLSATRVPVQVLWGDLVVTVEMDENAERVLRNHTVDQSSEILSSMVAIADWARTGKVALFDSAELKFEWMGVRPPTLRGTEADVFKDVNIGSARVPVFRRGFPPFERESFDMEKRTFLASIRDPRFQELTSAVAARHAADVFHLWTAEVNFMNCYLTLDRRFINAWRNQRKAVSEVEVLTPSKLCAELSEVPK
jgi:hypothetical protein